MKEKTKILKLCQPCCSNCPTISKDPNRPGNVIITDDYGGTISIPTTSAKMIPEKLAEL